MAESPSPQRHNEVEAELLSFIRDFRRGDTDIHVFWRRYSFRYAEAPPESIAEEPGSFFFEVNERLHHADWASPSSDPALEDLDAFRRWLSAAIQTYESGGWDPSRHL